MNEFLFLALVIVYLAISYVPVSGAPKPTAQDLRNQRSTHGNTEPEAGEHL